jgi:hypothetical protein
LSLDAVRRLSYRPNRARDWCALNRRETIRELLERWDDLAGLSTASPGGGEGNVALQAHARGCGIWSSLRCSCWLLGVDELDRCLRALRASRPAVYRHLQARYGQTAKARRRFLRFRAGRWEGLQANEAVLIPRFSAGERGSWERVYDEVLVVRWPDWVELRMVEEGLDWLERAMRVEPELPAEAA